MNGALSLFCQSGSHYQSGTEAGRRFGDNSGETSCVPEAVKGIHFKRQRDARWAEVEVTTRPCRLESASHDHPVVPGQRRGEYRLPVGIANVWVKVVEFTLRRPFRDQLTVTQRRRRHRIVISR